MKLKSRRTERDIVIHITPLALEQALASVIVIAMLFTLGYAVKKFIGELDMKIIYAFLMSMWEFRSDITLNFDDEGLQCEYVTGREWAHRLTFRRFEQ